MSGLRGAALLLSALLLLASCGTPSAPAEHSVNEPTAAVVPDRHIVAVLVAGDASIDAFDDAMDYFEDMLPDPKAEIHRLTARRHHPADVEASTSSAVQARLQSLRPSAASECLVYMTSHGTRNGFFLAPSGDALTPAMLDKSLSDGCGSVPTIVIVSACFSGVFVEPVMQKPNRIILTAARPDRTSFGCGAGFAYTYFDECLLGALPNAADWHVAYDRARGCVAAREKQVNADPSEPQAFFGAAVSTMPTPWHAKRAEDLTAIQFTPGPLGFKPSLVPISHVELDRQAAELDQYAAASPPKALAVTPGGYLSIVTQSTSGQRSEDDVARLAVQRCEWLTGGACILFARDDRITELMPSGEPPFHPLLLPRAGRLTPAIMPFIRDDQRGEIAQYLAGPDPKALAVSPGHPEIGVGAGATIEAARSEALARCRAGVRDCVIYAEGDTITLGYGN